MIILRILCIVMLAGLSFSQDDAAAPSIPLAAVYTIVPNFPETDFCGRTCYSKFWMDPGNIRKVQFTGTLKPGETIKELCHCLYGYMNQNNWLAGVTPICIAQCDRVTLLLSGTKDPTYDPTAVDKKLDRPCEKLKAIAIQFKNDAKLVGLKCTMSHDEDKCGCIHVMIECPLNGDPRPKEKICESIKNYFNQGKNLDNTSINCNQRGSNLEMEFIGNADEGVDCEAPCFFTYDE